jgi:hypothetical protein
VIVSGRPAQPQHAWNLPVQSVEDLLAVRRAGSVRAGLVAVAGLLGQDPRAVGCDGPDPGLTATFCERTALLSADVEIGGDRRAVPHLHPRIKPGIPMPSVYRLDPQAPDEAGPVMRSIVIGRFASARPPVCPVDGGRCRDEFILERLAWAEGGWIDRILVRDPDAPEVEVPSRGPRYLAITAREADRMEQILSLAVLQPGRLAEIDPSAAASAAASAALAADRAGVSFEGPVWYVRSVGRPIVGQDARLTWAVVDHRSGLILASGTIDPGWGPLAR